MSEQPELKGMPKAKKRKPADKGRYRELTPSPRTLRQDRLTFPPEYLGYLKVRERLFPRDETAGSGAITALEPGQASPAPTETNTEVGHAQDQDQPPAL